MKTVCVDYKNQLKCADYIYIPSTDINNKISENLIFKFILYFEQDLLSNIKS